MGAGESSEKSRSNNNLSRSQVNSIIEEQRREFQRKYEELLKTKVGVDEAFLAEQTRIEARKEVDRLIKVNEEKMAQLMKEKEKMAKATLAAAQAPSPRAQAPAPPNPLVDTDRQRTPYSFSKNDLQIGVAQNSVTSIYPNLNERNGNRIGNTTPSTSCNNMNADIFPQLAKPNRNDGNFSYHGVSNTPNIPANYVNRAANIGNSNIEANRTRFRNRPRPRQPPTGHPYCFYHFTYGAKANKCKEPCSFYLSNSYLYERNRNRNDNLSPSTSRSTSHHDIFPQNISNSSHYYSNNTPTTLFCDTPIHPSRVHINSKIPANSDSLTANIRNTNRPRKAQRSPSKTRGRTRNRNRSLSRDPPEDHPPGCPGCN